MKKMFIGEDNRIVELHEIADAGTHTELAVSEMTCSRFLYLFASQKPISLERAAEEFEITLHREVSGKLIVTDSDSDVAIIISDPENFSRLYRFVESDEAECQEVKP